MRVSKFTPTNDLAGAITGVLEEDDKLSLECIGAEAVNQAVKGVIVASYMLEKSIGKKIYILPAFEMIRSKQTKTGESTRIVLNLRKYTELEE